MAIFYFIVLLIYSIVGYTRKAWKESTVVISIVILDVFVILLNYFQFTIGLDPIATVLSTAIYYIYFQINSYEVTIKENIAIRQVFLDKSNKDGLTDVFYKDIFLNRFSEELSFKNRNDSILIFIDVDKFKSVNDILGHLVGDDVLKDAANKLKNIVGKDGFVGRFGGDEFLIFLKNTDFSNLDKLLENLLHDLSHEYFHEGRTLKVTFSIGCVYVSKDSKEEVNTLIEEADTSMYKAKNNGGNQYVIFNAN